MWMSSGVSLAAALSSGYMLGQPARDCLPVLLSDSLPSIGLKADIERDTFSIAVEDLLRQTQFQSSLSAIKASPAFGQIVSLGDHAKRHIIDRMKAGEVRVHWFPLLKAITGQDPVAVHHRGALAEMAADWINWADGNSASL